MAEKEYKVVLTVNTGNSEKTVKGLKEEIGKLRDNILNLDKGTAEYDDAVAKLQADTRALNEVMGLTKKEAVALEGSYDALTFRMSQLKKEWKATNDEVRRQEIGAEIAEINSQLKSMDAEIGNYQRNVGNYSNDIEDAFKKLKDEIKQARKELLEAEEGTEEYEKAMNKLSDAQFKLRDMNEKSRYAVADFGEQLSNVVGITSGVVSGFSALQAAMVLAGGESEEFEKVIVKLQAAMALVQGLQGLEGMVDRIGGLAQAIKTAGKALGKAGWIGLLITAAAAITAVTVALVKKNRAMKDGEMTQKEYAKAIKETWKEELNSQAEELATLETLYRYATDKSLVGAWKIREKAAKALLVQLGQEANQTNVNALMAEKYAGNLRKAAKADGTFSEMVRKSVQSLLEKAKAQAALNLLTEKYEKILEAEVSLETAIDSGKSGKARQAKKDLANAQREFDELLERIYKEREFNSLLDEIISTEQKSASERCDIELETLEAIYQRRLEYNRISAKTEEEKAKAEYQINRELSAKRIEIMQKFLDEAKEVPVQLESVAKLEQQILDEQLNAEKLSYEEKKRLVEADKAAKEKAAKDLEDHYKKLDSILEHGLNQQLQYNEISNKTTEQKEATEFAIIDTFKKKELKLVEEHLSKLEEDEKTNADAILELEQRKADIILEIKKNRYENEERLREQNREKELEELEEFNEETNKALRRNAISDGTDSEKEKKAYLITLAALEKRKNMLSEFYKNAKTDGDKEAMLEYQQQLADIELEIDEAKYAEKERMRQEDLDNQKKSLDEFMKYLDYTSVGLDTVANVFDAIYANMEAQAEKNGEISEEEAKKLKGIQKAQAWVSALSGAVQAFAAAMQLGPIAGPIVGGINAAAMIAMAVANTQAIENQDMRGGSLTGAATSTPNVSSFQSEMPFSYTRNVTGAKEYDELNKSQRVYVVESDITDAQNRTKVRVEESSW